VPNEANVFDIDHQISQIQQSTRTSFNIFIPIHERLRMKYGWYYKWHLNRNAKWVHLAILALYILSLSAFGLFSYKAAEPKPTLASASADQYTASGAGSTDYNGVYTYDSALSIL
jgi:hypothetical protein